MGSGKATKKTKEQNEVIEKKRRTKKKSYANEEEEEDSYDALNRCLSTMGLTLQDVEGDGNCLFRSLSDQLYGTVDNYRDLRTEVCTYMKNNESEFKLFFSEEEESFEKHLNRMNQDGVFGDNFELVAFAKHFKKRIFIYHVDGNVMRIDGKEDLQGVDTLHIAYHPWEHYSSIRNKHGPFVGLPEIKINKEEEQENKKKYKSKEETKSNVQDKQEQNINQETKVESTINLLKGPKVTLNKRRQNQIDKIINKTGFKDQEIINKLLEENKSDGRKVTTILKKMIKQSKENNVPIINFIPDVKDNDNQVENKENDKQAEDKDCEQIEIEKVDKVNSNELDNFTTDVKMEKVSETKISKQENEQIPTESKVESKDEVAISINKEELDKKEQTNVVQLEINNQELSTCIPMKFNDNLNTTAHILLTEPKDNQGAYTPIPSSKSKDKQDTSVSTGPKTKTKKGKNRKEEKSILKAKKRKEKTFKASSNETFEIETVPKMKFIDI